MKNKKLIILLIVILVIICAVLVWFMVSMINGGFKFKFFNKVSTELVIDEEYENEFNKINISSNAADIYVKESSSDKVRVIIYGDKEKVKVNNYNNELNIESDVRASSFFSFNNKIAKIEVYVPSTYEREVKVANKYGNIEIGELSKANIKVEEDCGDITIRAGNEINVESSYGNVKLDKASNADIKQSAGDVEVGTVKDIKVKNNYGDIRIQKIQNYLDIEEDCGDIKIDNLTLNKNANIKNNFGDIKIGSTNEIYIDAKTDLGDVKINNNYNKSDITLKLENDCGDIKVEN